MSLDDVFKGLGAMDDAPRPAKVDNRRRRPALACSACRRSKIRCDRKHPCGACVRSRHKACVYETGYGPPSRASHVAVQQSAKQQSADARATGLPISPPSSSVTTAPTYEAGSSTGPVYLAHRPLRGDAEVPDVEALLKRLFELERRLDGPPHRQSSFNSSPNLPTQDTESIASYIAADFHVMTKGVVSKTRYFGPSHWMNGVTQFRSILELFEQQSTNSKSEALKVLLKCKGLGRTIKAQRHPGLIHKFGCEMPSKDVADKLVNAYLRTTETVFRVVHVPSFRRDYEQYWVAPDGAKTAFLILLQLLMAIGTTVQDSRFSMRKSAIRWVMEAQFWLLTLPAKGKLTIAGLQVMILLTLARTSAGIGGDLVWIHGGSLTRSALFMGLHRDPSRLPPMSRFDAEMRRRLWNTILELELQTAIDAGGYPMGLVDNSDTRAPADTDDANLMDDEPSTRSEANNHFTDMTVALALRESFRERLAVCQLLNATSYQGAYEDTLLVHGQFTKAYKNMISKLKSFKSLERQPTKFQIRLLEVFLRRYIMSLHLPYLTAGYQEPAFAFSRKQSIESAAKIYSAVFPTASQLQVSADEDSDSIITDGDDLAYFNICGAGFWRSILCQASMALALELQQEMTEDDGLGPPTPRPDLLNMLYHTVPYYLARIKAGETNVKGYLFTVALIAHIKAQIDGLKGRELIEPVLQAAMKTETQCFEILKSQLAPSQDTGTDADPTQFDWDSALHVDQDWGDTAMTGSFFDVAGVESFLENDDGDGDFDFMSSFAPWWQRA
ncbi:hypothetical protein F5Y16DRAFT_88371 [Xylariaceae sp. FL0255]|nr:hypothetical protein F5Y16DRAFT_88371 [Xylariaceae sp. FL0255]